MKASFYYVAHHKFYSALGSSCRSRLFVESATHVPVPGSLQAFFLQVMSTSLQVFSVPNTTLSLPSRASYHLFRSMPLLCVHRYFCPSAVRHTLHLVHRVHREASHVLSCRLHSRRRKLLMNAAILNFPPLSRKRIAQIEIAAYFIRYPLRWWL